MIGASEWIERAAVAPAIGDAWPNYRVWLVAADEVDTNRLADVARDLARQAIEQARSAEDVERHVQLWQDAYRGFGVKPRVARSSIDALLRRARSEQGLPTINVGVDIYNAISVLHRVPIGGEDLDRYDGAARLVIASGDEPFHTVRDGERVVEHPEVGEPVWVDGSGVTCRRWNWRQTTRTAISPETRRFGFIVDSLDGPGHAGARAAAEQLAALLLNAELRAIDARPPC